MKHVKPELWRSLKSLRCVSCVQMLLILFESVHVVLSNTASLILHLYWPNVLNDLRFLSLINSGNPAGTSTTTDTGASSEQSILSQPGIKQQIRSLTKGKLHQKVGSNYSNGEGRLRLACAVK